jgi:hypothetical protein
MSTSMPVSALDPRRPSVEAELTSAFYRAWSMHRVAQEPLQKIRRTASEGLWIGSYFELAQPWIAPSWNFLDIDMDMLLVGRRTLPGQRMVQGNIQQLPFSARFDTVVALGAVTAYLLDDDSVARTAASLRSALVATPSARLLVDAYDRDSIHETDYFRGCGRWVHANTRFRHTVETRCASDGDDVFLVELTIVNEDNGHSQCLQFRQRAFASAALAQMFERAGLRLIETFTDTAQGRLYHTYGLR